MVTATEIILEEYYVCLEIFVVATTVDIFQLYCVVCGDYCGYINSRYCAMVLCCVWSLLRLQQQ